METKKISNLKKITLLVRDKKTLLSLGALIIAYILNYQASLFLMRKYGDNLPLLPDLFLDSLPYLKIAFLYDLLAIITIFTFIIYAFKYEFKSAPYFLLISAISQVTRAAFIIMTPFGSPNGLDVGLFSSADNLFGLYPSGHIMFMFLAYSLSKGIFKKINLAILITTPIILLLSRGHYSIDIFSGIFFGYAIYSFGEKHLRKKMEANIKAE